MNMNRITVKQLSETLNVPASTIRRWVRDGQIPHERLCVRCIRVDPEVIEAWLAERLCSGTLPADGSASGPGWG